MGKTAQARMELRDRLRVAILGLDMTTVEEVLNDPRFDVDKDLNREDHNGRTPLLNAAFVNRIDMVARLLEAGAHGGAAERDTGNTLFHYLSKPREPTSATDLLLLKQIFHTAIAHGQMPNSVDSAGYTPMHYAAQMSNKWCVGILSQLGAPVNKLSTRGDSPLSLCIRYQQEGWIDCCMMLLKSGADPNRVGPESQSPAPLAWCTENASTFGEPGARLLEAMLAVKASDLGQDENPVNAITGIVGPVEVTRIKQRNKPGSRLARSASMASEQGSKGAPALRFVSDLDRALISAPPSDAVDCKYGSPGLRKDAIRVTGLYSPYRTQFFGQAHFLFVAKGLQQGAGNKVVAILRLPNEARREYYMLVFNRFGIFDMWIPQAQIVGEDNLGCESPRNLEDRFLQYLKTEWSTALADYRLLDSRFDSDALAALASAPAHNAAGQGLVWTMVSSTKSDLGPLLLAFECRLGLNKRVSVGVIYNTGGQTEEEAFLNSSDRIATVGLHKLLNILGTRVPLEGWEHYSGGVSSTQESHIWYTSWRGFEIVFHVAPDMSPQSQRQFLGNDKCLIYYSERGPIIPEFRGNVNSVAIVVQCLDEQEAADYNSQHQEVWETSGELARDGTMTPISSSLSVSNLSAVVRDGNHSGSGSPLPSARLVAPQQQEGTTSSPSDSPLTTARIMTSDVVIESPSLKLKRKQNKPSLAWRIGVFYRKRVVNFNPCVTTSLLRDQALLRDVVLANVVNGTSKVIQSPPYSVSVGALFTEGTDEIVKRFTTPDLKKSHSVIIK